MLIFKNLNCLSLNKPVLRIQIEEEISVREKRLEQVSGFKYIDVSINADSSIREDLNESICGASRLS